MLAIVVASAFLWNVIYTTARRSQLENINEEDLRDLLGTEAYANVSLVDGRIVQERTTFTQRTRQVVVTTGRSPGENHLTLRREISDRVDEQVGRDVEVRSRCR